QADLLVLDSKMQAWPQLMLRSNHLYLSWHDDQLCLWREVIGHVLSNEILESDLLITDKSYVLSAKIHLDDAWLNLPQDLFEDPRLLHNLLNIPEGYGAFVDWYWCLESHVLINAHEQVSWFIHLNYERSSSSILAF